MIPYRENANRTFADVVDERGRKILTAEFPVNDVEVEYWYETAGGCKSISEKIEGSQSSNEVEERSENPGSWVASNGENKLHHKLEHATKYGTLWINDDLGIPWHRVFSARITKRIERTYRMRYVLRTEYGD